MLSPEAQELYDQVYEIYNKLADEFDLNAPFKDYQRMTCEYFESKGHASLLNSKAPLNGYVHSLGHGVGLNIHERPFSHLTVGDDHRLAPGVIIHHPSRDYIIPKKAWASALKIQSGCDRMARWKSLLNIRMILFCR